MTTTINGSSPSITFSDGSAQTSATRPFQNRIINGAMVLAQRGTTFSGLSDDGGQYTLDRWRWSENGTYTGSQTVTQDSSAPVGFSNSLRVVTNTAITTGTSLSSRIEQFIEGFNSADLQWGTANAKTITLSFWVKSSLTGTFGGALRNSADDRSYPFSYTISVADTWEQKSVTIAGDTSGTWVGATNGVGIRVTFSLGAGTSLSGTAGAWSASGAQSVTGAVAVNATTSANWAITGCQFEVGSTATSFDYRPYGTELALCQRYYYKNNYAATKIIGTVQAYSTNGQAFGQLFTHPVPMRATPTSSNSGGTSFQLANINSSRSATTSIVIDPSIQGIHLGDSGSGATTVAGGASVFYSNTSGTSFIDVSAEL